MAAASGPPLRSVLARQGKSLCGEGASGDLILGFGLGPPACDDGQVGIRWWA